jgi:uncharacterized glyoxalase superfamily protein PhnB
MTIATSYIFWGLCREAISFYCRVFNFEVLKMTTYGDCSVLLHPSGCRLFMCDSITLLLSNDPIGEINKGHLSERGCRVGSAFEVCNLSEAEITAMYKQLVDNTSIVHFQLGPKGNLKLYASVMDRYNISWNLSCE